MKETKKTFKAWVTARALTDGISEIEAEEVGMGGMIHVPDARQLITYYGEGKEWHRTKESAIARAEEMRKKKIKSLKKKLAKLEKLTFE